MSFFRTRASTVDFNGVPAMAYQAQPASVAKHEAVAGFVTSRTRAGLKPLDGPPNAHGEDDEFKHWP
jgi:hypothetical protein